MEIKLAHRVEHVKPSATLALSARAAKMKASGGDVINLSVGEPDFDTPQHIKDAAIRAINAGYTKYTPVDGIQPLKEAIIQKFRNENNLEYGLDQVMATSGGKQALYNLCQAYLNDGDEVIIPAPYWVSYPEMVTLAGGVPVIVDTPLEHRFKIRPEQLASAITPRTRLFIINSPSNPSGMAYTEAELKALGEVLLQHPNILVITDDMYEHILWSQKSYINIINACPELYERTLVVNAASKTYSMTGWRIGYTAGPANLINAMKNVQSQSTSNPTSISQYAALAALTGDQQCVRDMAKVYRRRHDLVLEKLRTIKGIETVASDGSFYLFPRVTEAMDSMGMKTDSEFAEFLLKKSGVTVVPGSAFGLNGYMRISIATSDAILADAMERIKTLVD
jgi:aspartate aminotransferase